MSLFIFAIALLTSAQINPQTTTLATEAINLTSDGKPSRCEIDFIALNRDDVDGEGKMVGVKGTYGLDLIPGYPLFEIVKLTYQDIDGSQVGPNRAPFSVSIVGANGQSNVAARAYQSKGETGDSLIAGFAALRDVNTIVGVANSRRLKLLFNRQEGMADVLVDVDLLILDSDGRVDKRGEDTLRQFKKCLVPLLDEAKLQIDAQHDREVDVSKAPVAAKR